MNVTTQNMNVIGIVQIILFDHLAFTISSGLMKPDHKSISNLDVCLPNSDFDLYSVSIQVYELYICRYFLHKHF